MSGLKDHHLSERPYPFTAGFKEQSTSREAAEAIEAPGRAARLRERVREYMAKGHDATADEIAAALDEAPLSIRPRVAELHKQGVLKKTGQRRPSSEGRSSHVWRAA